MPDADKSSPRPWRWEDPSAGMGDGYEGSIDRLLDANGEVVCDFGDCTQYYPACGSPPTVPNINLILRAVNRGPAFDALVAALKPFALFAALNENGPTKNGGCRSLPDGTALFLEHPNGVQDTGLTLGICRAALAALKLAEAP